MQDAATVLDVIGKRGARGLPAERLYRQMFNPQLYLMAYGKLYANKGAMTPGVSGEAVDGMSLAKIGAVIGALRAERYRWQPVKRVYIPKKNGKKRPLGLPTWSDKLVAEGVRLLLEADYEPRFSGRPHRFRPAAAAHPGGSGRGVRDRAGPQARGPGRSTQAHPAPTPAPQPGPRRPGLPAAQVCPLCRRLAAGVRRSQARGRGHQVEDRGVPARRTEARTVAVQDADHARHQPGGALPRLRDQSPALRHQDHPAAPGGQRGDRAVRAEGRHPAAVRALHE